MEISCLYLATNWEKMEPSTATHIAELFALNSTTLLGAVIDAHCVGITLWDIGLETDTTEGIRIMHFALK